MNTLRSFFVLHYTYSKPADQRRAQGLLYLNAFAIVLAAGVALLLFVVANSPSFPAMVLLVPSLLLLAFSSIQLIQRGHLGIPIALYIGFSWFSSLTLSVIIGINSQVVVVLGFPIIAAGVLLRRRSVVLISALVIFSVLVGAWVEQTLVRPGTDVLRSVPAVMVALGFYSLVLWLFAGEYLETFERLAGVQTRLEAESIFGQNIAQTQDATQLFRQIVDTLHSLFELQHARLFLVDENDPNGLRMRAESGLMSRTEKVSVRLAAATPVSEAFRTGEPVIATTEDMSSRWRELLPEMRSQLALPLRAGNVMIGVLDLQSSQVDFFDAFRVSGLSTVGALSASALRSADLYVLVQQQAAELDQLYSQIHRNLQDIQRLNRQITGRAWQRFFDERGTTIMGYDLLPSAQPTPSEAITPTLEETLRQGEVAVQTTEKGNLLSVPVVLRGQTLGAMEFEIGGEGEVPQRFIDLASAVAERLALALDNVRLFEQAQMMAQRERQIGLIASHLQRAGSLENLLSIAAQEFSAALDGAHTRVRLKLDDSGGQPAPAAPSNGSSNGEGEA